MSRAFIFTGVAGEVSAARATRLGVELPLNMPLDPEGASFDIDSVTEFWQLLPDEFDTLSRRDRKIIQACWKALIAQSGSLLGEVSGASLIHSLMDGPGWDMRRWVSVDFERVIVPSLTPLVVPSSGSITSSRTVEVGSSGEGSATFRHLGDVGQGWMVPLRAQQSLHGVRTIRVDWGGATLSSTGMLIGYSFAEPSLPDWGLGVYLAVGRDGALGWVWGQSYHPCGKVDDLSSLDSISIRMVSSGGTTTLSARADSFDVKELRVPSDAVIGAARVTPLYRDMALGFVERTDANDRLLGDQTLGTFLASSSPLPGETSRWGPTPTNVTLTEGYRSFRVTAYDTGLPVIEGGHIDVVPVIRAAASTRPWVHDIDYELSILERDPVQVSISWAAHTTPPATGFLDAIAIEGTTALWGTFLQSIGSNSAWVKDSSSNASELRHRLASIIWALMQGPTATALSVAVGALTGAAFAIEPGQVTSTHLADGGHGVQILGPDGIREYPVDDDLELVVRVGDEVRAWQPLSEGAQVLDWVSGRPRLLDAIQVAGGTEPEQFGRVLAMIPLTSRVADQWEEASAQVRSLLQAALPVWAGSAATFIMAIRSISDSLSIRTQIRFPGYREGIEASTRLRVSEPFAGRRLVRYGGDGQGYLASYDGDTTYGEERWNRLPDVLRLTLTNNGGADYVGIDSDYEEMIIPAGESEETTWVSAEEYTFYFTMTVGDGESAAIMLDGTEYSGAPGEDVIIETTRPAASGTFTFTFTNNAASEATITIGEETLVLAGGATGTITVTVE